VRLAGARVLLTGADGGIGRVLAPLLADRGAHLVLTGLDAQTLSSQAGSLGGQAIPFPLGSAADAYALGEKAGPVDIVIHGAGLGHRGLVEQMTPERIEQLVSLDLTAPIALTRAVLPAMLERGSGHVCFVGSIAGQLAVAQEAAYAGAKGGLAVFADSLRLEVAHRGVQVSVVAPAAVDTGFFANRGEAYHRQKPAPMPADRVARAIVRAVEGGRATSIVPEWMTVAVRIRGVSPRTYDRLVRRFDS
jgi:short-subunit dehydrogenase